MKISLGLAKSNCCNQPMIEQNLMVFMNAFFVHVVRHPVLAIGGTLINIWVPLYCGVADDYSKANFKKTETQDANGLVAGSFVIALPDGRIQTTTYTADHVNGFVADVTYEGTPVYPPE